MVDTSKPVSEFQSASPDQQELHLDSVEEGEAMRPTLPADAPELLTSVRVVCRERPCVGALLHVAEKLGALLDYSRLWTLPKAAKIGSVRLLTRVMEATDNDPGLSSKEKRMQYLEATKFATGRRWLEAVQLLYARNAGVLTTNQAMVAALTGDCALLEWIHAAKPTLFQTQGNILVWMAFNEAAKSGEIWTVQWLVNTFPEIPYYLAPAAASGNLELVKWLHRHAGCDPNRLPVLSDGFMIHYRVTKYYIEQRSDSEAELNTGWGWHTRQPQSTDAIDWAASGGYLEVVQWLHANRQDGCTTKAMDSAAAGGHLTVVQWLHDNRTEGCTTDAIDQAATNGHTEMARWLFTHRTEGYTSKAVDGAIVKGNLEMLQLLYVYRSEEWSSEVMDGAAQRGQLEVVKWLHENRSEGCTTNAMDEAAANGHLEMVKWLHANRSEGCTTEAMDLAATKGQLEMVTWLHRNRGEGCTTKAMDRAAAKGHLAVVQFLHENRQEGGTYHAYYYARRYRRDEVASWLEENHVVPLVRTDFALVKSSAME